MSATSAYSTLVIPVIMSGLLLFLISSAISFVLLFVSVLVFAFPLPSDARGLADLPGRLYRLLVGRVTHIGKADLEILAVEAARRGLV